MFSVWRVKRFLFENVVMYILKSLRYIRKMLMYILQFCDVYLKTLIHIFRRVTSVHVKHWTVVVLKARMISAPVVNAKLC